MPGYRTAQGKVVDMAQMVARNEKVRAVGNMNVNARGDIIDSHNRVIQDNTKRVKNNYQKGVSQRQPQQSSTPKNIPIVETVPAVNELSEVEKELFDDDEDVIK